MSNPIIENQKITDTLEQNYMPYAMSVIISRAIPEIDGFKPSHRKLLYTMYSMGLLKGNKTKSANVVGQTMKLNPHGDSAIYETMVRLTEGNQALLHPLVESKGNFGRQYSRDMAYAASRYTEVKLSRICSEIFADIDKNTVDLVDNYDGTMKEPTLLPTTFPNILVNPNQGIAVGMASNICSFNLKEICNTTIAIMKKPNIKTSEIMEQLLAPDFSTGGEIIYNPKTMQDIYETGRGSFKIRAKYRYDRKENCIDILEIPYTTSIEAIIEKIVEIVKLGKAKEISDIRDETDLSGLKITIDLKKGTDPEKLMAKLFKMTPLQDSFGCNFNVLINSSPRVMGIKELISEWIIFRKDCIRRAITFDIAKKTDKLHLLKGLEKILLDIDKAIRIVRETEEDSMVIPNLMNGFSIDKIQAEYVSEIKLRNLNREYILNRTKEISELISELEELKLTLSDEKRIEKIIEKQLKEVSKKFGEERKSSIIDEENIQTIVEDETVEDYKLKLFRTEHNYIKKISLVSLRSSGEQKLKDNDRIVDEIEISNTAEALFFSDKGEVYKLKVNDIPDCKASQLGEYIPNLLGLSDDETIVAMTATIDFEGYVMFCFENGKIAKIPLESYKTKLNRKKLTNAYSLISKLVKILFITEECDMVAYSNIGKVLVFSSDSVPIKTTKNSRGVNVLESKKGSVLADVKFLSETEFKNPDYYRKKIPAVGCFLKDEDATLSQMSLFN